MIEGTRTIIKQNCPLYPESLNRIDNPPDKLYTIGDPERLSFDCLAILGHIKPSSYGQHMSSILSAYAADCGITIITGGSIGCATIALKTALKSDKPPIVVAGGGCAVPYPKANADLFQSIVDAGGTIVSEYPWDMPPMVGNNFRTRSRLVTGFARAVLVVEASVPSGSYDAAFNAMRAEKDILAVPGNGTELLSYGPNKLILDGACPIWNIDSMADALFAINGNLCNKHQNIKRWS